MILKLERSDSGFVGIHPRRPYRYVFIDQKALDSIYRINAILSENDIKLVVTRALENEGMLLKVAHSCFRRFGAALFCLVFPHRYTESKHIFSANGHDRVATNIDVDILQSGKKIVLLPYGVFTPKYMILKNYNDNKLAVDAVWDALNRFGFSIHANIVESMQIHCEFDEKVPVGPNHP